MKKTLMLLGAIWLAATCAWPQASTGTVSGTVRDQTGAVIPKAPVEIVNVGTAVVSTTETSEVGRFFFPGVTPGSYRIAVASPGMSKYQSSFTVLVQQSVVIDPVLRPGDTSTVVEVVASTPLLTVDSPVMGQTLEREFIEQLPIDGRNIRNLLQTIPEVEGWRAFGMPEATMEVVLDGAPSMNRRWSDHTTLQGLLDTVQEFRLESQSSAKYSRPTTLIMSTRSGTGRFHGSLFETNRTSGFGVARRRQDNYEKPPHLVRNEFGASAGGPVYLPKLYDGRNRTFFFAGWEALRQATSVTQGWQVPTMAMRQGDFSGLTLADGRQPVLYDPWTTDSTTYMRQPFADGGKLNVIGPNRMSPLAKYLYSITPEPTTAANPLVENNWWGTVPTRLNTWSFSTRVDHRFSDADQAYVRYTETGRTYRGQTRAQLMLNGVAGSSAENVPTKTLAVNYVRTFSPTLFNELLVTGFHTDYENGPIGLGTDWAGMLGLPNPFGVERFPQITGTGLNGYSFQTNLVQRYTAAHMELDDHLTRIHGKHELQFGFHYRYNQSNQEAQQQNVEGAHDFGTLATALYDPKSTPTNPIAQGLTGHNLANMFIGVMNYSNWLCRGYYLMRERDLAVYFQDNYKVTPRLTLNFGLRYEYWPVAREKFHTLAGYDMAAKSVVLASPLEELYARGAAVPSVVARYQELGVRFTDWQTAGMPRDLVNGTKGNLGPRLGFAYRAFDGRKSFIIRGGYSLSYFPPGIYQWQDSDKANVPFNATFRNNSAIAAEMSPDGLQNWALRSVPTMIAGVNSANAVGLDRPDGITRGTGSMNFLHPDQPTSRVHSWNLTFEKEVLPSTVARVRYVGNHGARLNQYENFNNPVPNYIWYVTTGEPLPTGEYANVARRPHDNTSLGWMRTLRKDGWSNFNGMEFQMERRYHRFAAFQVAYIVGNTLATNPYGQARNTPGVHEYLPGAVPADFVERNRMINYQRDTSNNLAKHRVKWNWLVDLPVGRGKPLLRNIGPALDKLVGGWQVSGYGQVRSTYFTLPTNIYPTTDNPLEFYGYKYPIQDCRSGTCVPGYLWFNSYIPPHQINQPNGYMGIPADYKPAGQPLIPHNATGYAAGDLGTNNVWVPLNNGNVQKIAYNDNLHPWRQQYFPSTRQWTVDASLVKNIQIRESVALRLNVDFFNVFNNPGNNPGIGGDGMLRTNTSANAARVAQLSMRLTWYTGAHN